MIDTDQVPSSQGSPFWRFSLRFYRARAVADACIALQDGAGVDVNLLLFLLWQALKGRSLTVEDVGRLERKIAPWRDTTVIPLRAMRRALKTPPSLVVAAAAESFRSRIKTVELEAERLQQEAMCDLARASPLGDEVPSRDAAARASIAAYEMILTAPFPRPAVDTLIGALATLELKPEEQ
jgi:uncharacterized protein (TIGR02444 family)